MKKEEAENVLQQVPTELLKVMSSVTLKEAEVYKKLVISQLKAFREMTPNVLMPELLMSLDDLKFTDFEHLVRMASCEGDEKPKEVKERAMLILAIIATLTSIGLSEMSLTALSETISVRDNCTTPPVSEN